jgi:hypothetical protein
MPGVQQLGEGVEEVERAASLGLDQVVDARGEVLESARRVEPVHFDVVVGHQRRMLGEPDVQDAAALRARLGDERVEDGAEGVQVVHLPDDVVAQAEAVDGLVEPGDAGAGALCCHGGPLRRRSSGGDVAHRTC